MFEAVETGHVTILVTFDLSAAFDTIDCSCRRLEHSFGIIGSALSWVCSYLDGWSQSLQVGGALSNIIRLDIEVSQGISLSPLFFSLFVTPLAT